MSPSSSKTQYRELSGLRDLDRHLSREPSGANGKELRAKVVVVGGAARYVLYTSKNKKGTGFKEWLGIVDQRRENAREALKMLEKLTAKVPDEKIFSERSAKLRRTEGPMTVQKFKDQLKFETPSEAIRHDVLTWEDESKKHCDDIRSSVDAVKSIGEQLDEANDPADIDTVRRNLGNAMIDLQKKQDAYQLWRDSGVGSKTGCAPSGGVDGLMPRAQVVRNDLLPRERTELEAYHSTMLSTSEDAIKAMRKEADVACAEWKARLDLSAMSPSPQGITEAERILKGRLKEVQDLASKLQAEIAPKKSEMEALIAQLKDAESETSQRLVRTDKFMTEFNAKSAERNKIQGYIDLVNKQVADLKDAVPESLRANPQIDLSIRNLLKCAGEHNRLMREADAAFGNCNALVNSKRRPSANT